MSIHSKLKSLVVKTTAAVDYATYTTRDAGASADLLRHLYDAVGQGFVHQHQPRPWHFKGYHGQQFPGVRYGIRGDEAIVVLSGSLAGEHWATLAPKRRQCSRFDIALTATMSEPYPTLATEIYTALQSDDRKNLRFVTSTRGGSTLYVGARTSQFFGRLYDKSAERGQEPGLVWRWEVECKKPKSEAVVQRLLEESDPGGFIAVYVSNWFAFRSVIAPEVDANRECAIEIEAHVTTPARKLHWLTTQVRPTVGRLINEGYTQEVLDALNLPRYMQDALRASESDE